MTSDIGPGDWVEARYTYESIDKVYCGQLYHVEHLFPGRAGWWCDVCREENTPEIGVTTDTDKSTGWCICTFRPIYRPKGRELIEGLKAGHDITAEDFLDIVMETQS